ncbi:MAG: hypothetical protein WC980_01960 [Candidatus Brocadiia bacterium]
MPNQLKSRKQPLINPPSKPGHRPESVIITREMAGKETVRRGNISHLLPCFWTVTLTAPE